MARKFDKRFLFRVEVDGVERAAFADFSALKGQAGDVEHWEGGSLIANKEPGRITFDDVTLSRGMTDDKDLFNQWERIFKVGNGEGGYGEDENLDFTMDVVQLNRDQSEARRWRVDVAHVKAFEHGGWDNKADEVAVEKLVLRVNFFQRPGK